MRPLRWRAAASELSAARNSICASCRLQQRRPFASSTSSIPTSSSSSSPTTPSSGLAPLSSRHVLSVAGPDASKFLQGLVTANIVAKDGLPKPQGSYAGFLTATGRVLHDVFIYPYGGGLPGLPGDTNASASENGEAGFLIEADAAQMDSLARYIKRYKLRAKVTIRRLQPGEISVWQAWDENPGTGGKIRPSQSSAGIILEDPRAPGLGYRVLQAGDRPPELDLDQVSEGAYTVRRYLRGVPEGQQEIIKEHALPQESNMDLMNAIDFRKGCYVGQELTIRTRHRGVVRKRILPCVVYGVDEPAPQSLQYDPDSTAAASVPPDTSIGRSEKRGRSAGKWLRGIGNIGLGLCRLEVMTGITLPGETAATAYQPDHEFVLQWGDEDADKTGVKVKAFVPNWIKNGLDEAAASHG